MRRLVRIFLYACITALFLVLSACEYIPEGHKGYCEQGHTVGPGDGGHHIVASVNCSYGTVNRQFTALTKDGSDVSLYFNVRYAANCSDSAIPLIVASVGVDGRGDKAGTISPDAIYDFYVSPAATAAMREAIASRTAEDIKARRGEMLLDVQSRFDKLVAGKPVRIAEFSFSNTNPLTVREEPKPAPKESRPTLAERIDVVGQALERNRALSTALLVVCGFLFMVVVTLVAGRVVPKIVESRAALKREREARVVKLEAAKSAEDIAETLLVNRDLAKSVWQKIDAKLKEDETKTS